MHGRKLKKKINQKGNPIRKQKKKRKKSQKPEERNKKEKVKLTQFESFSKPKQNLIFT